MARRFYWASIRMIITMTIFRDDLYCLSSGIRMTLSSTLNATHANGLELGGDGRITEAIARVCPVVHGIDRHPGMIRRAQVNTSRSLVPKSHTLITPW